MMLMTVISLNMRCQGNIHKLLMPMCGRKKCPPHGLAYRTYLAGIGIIDGNHI